MSLEIILSYIIGIAILVILLKVLTLPLKIIFKFLFNSIIGGIILAICAFFGIIVNVYWWTVLLTGLFGVPGFICAALITLII